MSTASEVEGVAIQLYESDCRLRAREGGKRNVLSFVRAYLGLPAWTATSPPTRDEYRSKALRMLSECDLYLKTWEDDR